MADERQAEFFEWSQRSTSISHFLVELIRHLRTKEFKIGPNELSDAVASIQVFNGLGSYAGLRAACRTALVKGRRQYLLFDNLFDTFWKEKQRSKDAKIEDRSSPSRSLRKTEPRFDSIKEWLYAGKHHDTVEIAVYSPGKSLSQTPFIELSDEEIQAVIQLIQKYAQTLARQINRRRIKANRGQIDLRKLIRKNLKYGGEMINLIYKRPDQNRTQFVVLCDVSRSMELYTRFFIHFMIGLHRAYRDVETFVFSTQLHHITSKLNLSDPDHVLESLLSDAESWGSGTRISESLKHFVDSHLHARVNSNTIVMILSDGWDTADASMLSQYFRRIRQRAKHVYWLNPLMGHADFRPETAALKAAVPYLHGMYPVHHLDGLRRFFNAII